MSNELDAELIEALKLLAHPKFTTDEKGRVLYYVTKSDVEFARSVLANIKAAASEITEGSNHE